MATKSSKNRVKAGKSDKESRHNAFVEHYLRNGGNATQAAISAGYSRASARESGPRLLRNAVIAEKIAKVRNRALEGLKLETDKVIMEAARIAFFDPRKLMNKEGKRIPIHEMDDDTAAVVSIDEVFDRDGNFVGFSRSFRTSEKNAALEKIFKHLGLYEKDNSQTGPAAMRELMAALGAKAGGFKVKQP